MHVSVTRDAVITVITDLRGDILTMTTASSTAWGSVTSTASFSVTHTHTGGLGGELDVSRDLILTDRYLMVLLGVNLLGSKDLCEDTANVIHIIIIIFISKSLINKKSILDRGSMIF